MLLKVGNNERKRHTMDQAPIVITLLITMPTLLKNCLFHWRYASNLIMLDSGGKKDRPTFKNSYLVTHID